jgi:hypothetical protein
LDELAGGEGGIEVLGRVFRVPPFGEEDVKGNGDVVEASLDGLLALKHAERFKLAVGLPLPLGWHSDHWVLPPCLSTIALIAESFALFRLGIIPGWLLLR